MIDQAAIEAEIKRGVPNEAAKREEYRRNALYYDGEFTEDVQVWMLDEAGPMFRREDIRTSRIMRRVIDVLTSNLYRVGPERSIIDNAPATEWLGTLYQDRAVDALWQEADRLSLVNHVAAFEVYGDESPDAPSPVGIRLWGGEELYVWTIPGDPRTPGAVATRFVEDQQTTVRLWTAGQVVEFRTAKGYAFGPGSQLQEVKREPNPWGWLPFAFVHATYPARYFTPQGPPAGTYLRWLNYHLNYRMSQAACDINNTRPLAVIEGGGDYEFERRRAGDWQTLPALPDAGGNLIASPQARYVTCDLSFLASDSEDLRQYIDHALEMLGIPAVAVRMEQTATKSGVSLVAEQIPLAQWAEQRTRPFTHYERDLARLCFRAGAMLGAGDGLDAAAAMPGGITLRWPEMLVELPGAERDAHDQWMFDNGLMSKKQWLMLRENLTDEEARSRLDDVAEERKAESEEAIALQQKMMPAGQQPPAVASGPVGNDTVLGGNV